MKHKLQITTILLAIMSAFYLLGALLNWNLHFGHWNIVAQITFIMVLVMFHLLIAFCAADFSIFAWRWLLRVFFAVVIIQMIDEKNLI